MANTIQAKKRARQSEKRRQENASHRSRLRTFVKKTATSIESGNLEQAQAIFSAATSVIDKMLQKGLIHKNNAARRKSRLNAKLKKLVK